MGAAGRTLEGLAGWWQRPGVRETRLFALLSLGIACVMLWPAILGMGVLAPTDIVAYDHFIAGRPAEAPQPLPDNPLMGDIVDTFVPWKLFARGQLEQGRFPLWNPYNLLGTHFHANLQSQLFSPFFLLWMLFPPLWGLGAVTAIKWAVGGLGMAFLLRRLGVGVPASVFGLIAFQLSGPVLGWLQWPITEGLVWVPWMMWAALGWLDARKPAWLAALSALVAFEVLAGHVETSFHSLAFASAFMAAAWIGQPRAGRSLVSLAGLVLAVLLGVLMTAAQWLPFAVALTDSFTWWLRGQVHTAGISMPSLSALQWLAPNGFGWPDAYTGPANWIEANPYVGALTLLLAAWGLAASLVSAGRPSRRWLTAEVVSPRRPLFWALGLAVSASMAYGIPPLSYLRELPGFNSSLNSRLISVAGPCAVALAAFGLDRLLALRGRVLPRWWAFAPPLLALAGLILLWSGWRAWTVGSLDSRAFSAAWQAWAGALFCAGALLLFAHLLGWLRPSSTALLALVLLALDLMRAGWGFNPTAVYDTFYPTNKLINFSAERGPTERLAVIGPYAESNILTAYRVPDYRVYDATISKRFMDFSRFLSPDTFRQSYERQDAGLTAHLVLFKPNAAIMSAVGIKWLLAANNEDPNSWQAAPDRGPVYKKTLSNRAFTLYENTYAMPYTYLAGRFHVITPEPTRTVEEISSRRVAAFGMGSYSTPQVEDPSSAFPSGVAPVEAGSGDEARVQAYAPGEITLAVKTSAPRLLVLNESWDEGWRAEVDGKPAAIFRTNYVVQSVAVPAGARQVRFVYEPPEFNTAIRLSMVGIVSWLVVVAWPLARRSRLRETLLEDRRAARGEVEVE